MIRPSNTHPLIVEKQDAGAERIFYESVMFYSCKVGNVYEGQN